MKKLKSKSKVTCPRAPDSQSEGLPILSNWLPSRPSQLYQMLINLPRCGGRKRWVPALGDRKKKRKTHTQSQRQRAYSLATAYFFLKDYLCHLAKSLFSTRLKKNQLRLECLKLSLEGLFSKGSWSTPDRKLSLNFKKWHMLPSINSSWQFTCFLGNRKFQCPSGNSFLYELVSLPLQNHVNSSGNIRGNFEQSILGPLSIVLKLQFSPKQNGDNGMIS